MSWLYVDQRVRRALVGGGYWQFRGYDYGTDGFRRRRVYRWRWL